MRYVHTVNHGLQVFPYLIRLLQLLEEKLSQDLCSTGWSNQSKYPQYAGFELGLSFP